MPSRRDILKGSSFLALSALAVSGSLPSWAKQQTPAGFQQQDWFHKTSFNLENDLAFAKNEGKTLALLWEQVGCSYCKKMHEVAFRDPEIVNLIRQNFVVVQMDMWGEREFLDMNDDTVTEATMARGYLIRGTPSAIFFDEIGDAIFQMPGYADPPVFKGVFQYVLEKGYNSQSFTDWYKSQNG